ncbi:MAG: nucleotide exchange factor GrpE [Simkaniaceae bacterium]
MKEESKKHPDGISLEEEKSHQDKTISEQEENPSSGSETEEKIQRLEEELQKYKEKHLHQLAEMENLRKRLQKERSDMARFAIENALADLLSPLDNFENALGFADQMNEEVKNWALGFQMILTQLKDVLENHHIRPFSSKGEFFDPHKHEAVEVEETEEHPDGMILEEFIKGYFCGDRILRPARVKVAKQPKQVSEEKDNNHKENPNDREEEKQ